VRPVAPAEADAVGTPRRAAGDGGAGSEGQRGRWRGEVWWRPLGALVGVVGSGGGQRGRWCGGGVRLRRWAPAWCPGRGGGAWRGGAVRCVVVSGLAPGRGVGGGGRRTWPVVPGAGGGHRLGAGSGWWGVAEGSVARWRGEVCGGVRSGALGEVLGGGRTAWPVSRHRGWRRLGMVGRGGGQRGARMRRAPGLGPRSGVVGRGSVGSSPRVRSGARMRWAPGPAPSAWWGGPRVDRSPAWGRSAG